MKRLIISAIALFAWGYSLQAQGYRIDVQIDDVKDSTIFLAVYGGEGKYVRDTAKTDKNGKAVFAKNKALVGGMYILVAGNIQLCDFLISDEKSQKFSIHYEKDKAKNAAEVIYKNSPENTAFAEFQKYMGLRQKARGRIYERTRTDTAFIAGAKDSLALIAKEEKAYCEKVAAQWKGKLLASVAMAVVPPPPVPEMDIPADNPKRDSLLWVHYYLWEKDHFFDNFDFSDGRLLNTPVFAPAFDYYFKKKIIQNPDSLISAIHPVLERAKANRELFMYCLGNLFNTYIQNKTYTVTPEYAVGTEAVVIDLIKNYYLSDDAGLTQKDTLFLRQIIEYMNNNESSLVGKKAHNMTMATLLGDTVSLYNMQSPYTLILFFDTECGHCKTEIPLIYDIYKKYRDRGLSVFCVYIKSNGPEWSTFVQEHKLDWTNVWDPYRKTHFDLFYNVSSTPQMYLLNKDKTIIARNLSHEFLAQYMGLLIDKKPISNTESISIKDN